jgi:hypothetical protein
MADPRQELHVGDVLSIAGLYDDGTREQNDTPPEDYDTTKTPQQWRVRYIGPEGINLQPLNRDGSVQAFNDAVGEFWIRTNGEAHG